MQFLLQNKVQYSSVIFKLSVLTSLSVLGCMMFGYFLLPPAAAFYACLLVYEKRGKRVMSYVIPVIMFTLNLLLKGFYSLEAVAYIAVGVVIYLTATRKVSKGEAVFWVVLVIALLMLLSCVLLAFELTGAVGVIPIKQFYSNLYRNFRDTFITKVTSLTRITKSGEVTFAYNAYEAESMLSELTILIIPTFAIVCFAGCGFSFKCFSRAVNKLSGQECGISEWSFRTSNLVAYFYLLLAVLNLFVSSAAGIFGFSLMTLSTIFLVVFAYVGIKYTYRFFLSRGRSELFSAIVLVVVFALLSSGAVSIFSYLGAVINIFVNKNSKESKSK